MKKFLLPLMAAFLLLATGCSKDARVVTLYYTVNPGEWQQNADDGGYGYYYAECQCPELTPDVIMDGAVTAYYLENSGNYSYDNQLPYLVPYYVNADDGTSSLYFENVRYDLSENFVTFIIQQSDNWAGSESRPTRQMKFKVCIIANR